VTRPSIPDPISVTSTVTPSMTTYSLDRSRAVYLLHEDLARAQIRERRREAERDALARRVRLARRHARRAEEASRRARRALATLS
jgi:hypothetical protein